MYKHSADLKQIIHKEFRGGKGEITMTHFLSDEPYVSSIGRLFAKTTIPPGSSVGLHAHEGDFECYYILSGQAKVWDDGTEVLLTAGDVHVCEDGKSHGIENIGTEDLVYIALILYSR